MVSRPLAVDGCDRRLGVPDYNRIDVRSVKTALLDDEYAHSLMSLNEAVADEALMGGMHRAREGVPLRRFNEVIRRRWAILGAS
jgi:hypothetical protein